MWEEHIGLVEMVGRLSREVRGAVRPLLGTVSAKGISGQGASGDATFGIDEVAEAAVERYLAEIGDVAYYTEDRGLVQVGKPGYILVIDPIDGTRPAAAGLESCCVSVAVASFREGDEKSLRLGDVFMGMVTEIKNDAVFTALKGHGVRMECGGRMLSPDLSEKTDISSIFWTMGFRGRPALPLITVLGELIDTSSVDGGCFDLGSATFCITRVLTGEMDIYVDVGQRMAAEVPVVREEFLRIGHGAILNNYPYDVAAAALIASEAGATVSDAYGNPLKDYKLIPSEGKGQLSVVVSGNPELHRLVLDEIDRGMSRLSAETHAGGSA